MSANYQGKKMHHYYQFFTRVESEVCRLKVKLFNKRFSYFMINCITEKVKKWIWISRWWWHLLKQIVYLFIYYIWKMRWNEVQMIYITTWEIQFFHSVEQIHTSQYFLQNTTNNRKKVHHIQHITRQVIFQTGLIEEM